MKLLQLIVILFSTLMSVSIFASDDPNFAEQVRIDGIVSDSESILLSSNVYFYPNKKGFGLLSGGNKRSKGYVVFTENSFAVVTWSRRSKAYEVLHQETYNELASTDISGNSPMLRLVTESKSSGKFNSYEIMDGRNALTPNVAKTKEAHKLIAAGIKGYDVKKVAAASDLSTVEIANQKRRMEELEERITRLEQADNAATAKSVESECDCKCPPN